MMHILVSSNTSYLSITLTMLHSLSIFGGEKNVKVWFLYRDIDEKKRTRFVEEVKYYCGFDVVFVEIDMKMFAALNGPIYIKHISVETYFRLVAQFVLPQDVDRILWLDSDIIVKGDIRDFYCQNIDDVALVASSNTQDKDINASLIKRLNLPKEYTYFNAGVILLNLDYLRLNTSLDYILDFCTKHTDDILLQDQDLLNMLYHSKARVYRDCRYNCIVNGLTEEEKACVDDVVVVHYAGWQKPWKVRWQDYVSHYYWDVRVLEKMKRSEYFVKFLGKFLSFICFNDIIRYVCAPYYWIKCRFESKQR